MSRRSAKSVLTSTFAALTSRWSMPNWCKHSTARSRAAKSVQATPSVKCPPGASATVASRLRPSKNSRTSTAPRGYVKKSKARMMFGCSTLRRSSYSCRAVLSSSSSWIRSTLRATCRPLERSHPLYTTAVVPWPRLSSTSNLSEMLWHSEFTKGFTAAAPTAAKLQSIGGGRNFRPPGRLRAAAGRPPACRIGGVPQRNCSAELLIGSVSTISVVPSQVCSCTDLYQCGARGGPVEATLGKDAVRSRKVLLGLSERSKSFIGCCRAAIPGPSTQQCGNSP
mmetsp:Transcript_31165/g.85737  ORF Transcript_31165/g.85737 Transcript_31165/m.85737 type:complete len:281 (+) Transcript_31165:580-1422(+)